MAKYDGPAFFRKKGVDFKNPQKLDDQGQSKISLSNDSFKPAIEIEKEPVDESQKNHSAFGAQAKTSETSNVEEKATRELPKIDRHPKLPRTNYLKQQKTEVTKPQDPAPLISGEQAADSMYPRRSAKVGQPQTNHVTAVKKTNYYKAHMEDKPATPARVSGSSSYTNASQLGYNFPSEDFLPAFNVNKENDDAWVTEQIQRLNDALLAFDVDAEVVDWTVGPTVTQFEVELGRGVKVNKITNLADDLKLQLAARDIRIEAPIPGKNTVGIEIPNPNPRAVPLSEILTSDAFYQSESPLTVALGVDLFGEPQVYDLRKMPHGLIAGATGSGKSVFINSVLISLLYKATPQDLKLLLIDPKTVELAPYNELPHLLSPVISDPKSASAALKWVTKEMDERYERLAAAGARNIEQFNKKAIQAGDEANKMPYIVVVIDELADLMMVSSAEVQDYIVRITQKARAAGIHLLIATQRPSVDVVTGLIKNNIPTRIAFMVSSQVDSRTILDHAGAERLLGRGDMLFLGNGKSNPVRLQGAYINEEIDDITDFVREQAAPKYAFNPDELKERVAERDNEDEIMGDVLDYLSQEDTISTSKLQRMFSIGYNRAATIIDQLEEYGYISEAHGSKPRDVYYSGSDEDSEDEDSFE